MKAYYPFIMCTWLMACAVPTRAQIRSGLLMTARGVVEVNTICADVARILGRSNPKDAKALAHKCTMASETLYTALEAGEKALDASEETKALCAVSDGFAGLKKMLDTVKVTFDKVPKVLVDALSTGEALSSIVAGRCNQ